MNDITYTQLRKRFNEAFELEPQRLPGTRYLKTFPFKIYVPFALLVACIALVFGGRFIIYLVTVLQYGF